MLGLECSTVCSRDVDVNTDRQKRLESFEMLIWRRMDKISWFDKVTNEEVLRRVKEDRQILNSIWQRKYRWIGHVLRHDGLLLEIIEGRMKGKPTRGRRRIQMLHNLANDGGFVALKRAAEDRGMETQRKDVKNLLYSRRLLIMMFACHCLTRRLAVTNRWHVSIRVTIILVRAGGAVDPGNFCRI